MKWSVSGKTFYYQNSLSDDYYWKGDVYLKSKISKHTSIVVDYEFEYDSYIKSPYTKDKRDPQRRPDVFLLTRPAIPTIESQTTRRAAVRAWRTDVRIEFDSC